MARRLRMALIGLALASVAAASVAETPAILNFTFTYEGSDEGRLIHNAQMSALRSTVGRFYFDDRVIIARDILDRYLENNLSEFIASITVRDRVVDQGNSRLLLEVAVFARELERSLQELRFFFTPRPTPLSFVFLQEILDDARQEVPVAKPLVVEALDDAGLQVSEIAILSPDSRTDVAEGGSDPADNPVLCDALRNAQRGGVELLFSGQCTTTLTDASDLYYDEHYFYETSLLLRMFRVDTGELLDEVVVTDSGSDVDDATAREIAIRKCVAAAIDRLIDTYSERWPREVLNQTDYLLMVTDVGDDEVDLLINKLADIDEEAQVFQRSFYADVACLNLVYSHPFETSPVAERQALIDYLLGMDTPQLRIESVDGRRIVARVVD
ncbi:hypothetical protein JXA47_00200 [Candidatus Sumerlaeota bacterium]|nr:hypothetical protein [Candidatus Sumerlaeota bacterium]